MFPPNRGRTLLRLVYIAVTFTFLFLLMNHSISKRKSSRTDDPYPLASDSEKINEIVVNLNISSERAELIVSEEDEEWELDEENIPDLSLVIGNRKNGPQYFSPNCAKFPNLFTVQFSNIHWQTQDTPNETYYLYSAYLDARGLEGEAQEDILKGAYVRILAMSDRLSLTSKNASLTTCQFWFENRPRPQFGIISDFRMIWNYKWGRSGHYYPYLITCQLPPNLPEMPISVSVVTSRCDNASNNLNILHRSRFVTDPEKENAPRKNFAVCVKALDFPDGDIMQFKLVEWIEMLRILGADKIFFYEFYVDPDIKRILDFYENQGIISVQQTTLPGDLPNQPQLRHFYIRGKKIDKRLTELIPYNDCLYRNMYDYNYVLVVDTDELIIPHDKINWSGLMERVNKNDIKYSDRNEITTYCFRNYYFLDGMLTGNEADVADIPEEFHMLRHVYRSKESTNYRYMKCFHKTDKTLGVHNHFAFFCRENKKCKRHYVKINRAQMNHYRSSCVNDIKNCSKYIADSERDEKIWRYKDELIGRVYEVIRGVT